MIGILLAAAVSSAQTAVNHVYCTTRACITGPPCSILQGNSGAPIHLHGSGNMVRNQDGSYTECSFDVDESAVSKPFNPANCIRVMGDGWFADNLINGQECYVIEDSKGATIYGQRFPGRVTVCVNRDERPALPYICSAHPLIKPHSSHRRAWRP